MNSKGMAIIIPMGEEAEEGLIIQIKEAEEEATTVMVMDFKDNSLD